MESVEFPQSRINDGDGCPMCRTKGGTLQKSKVFIIDGSGKPVEYFKWTCNFCGYTMLFDMTVVRKRPFEDAGVKEILPD